MDKINKICEILKSDKWLNCMLFIQKQKPLDFDDFLDLLIKEYKKGALITDKGLTNLLQKQFKQEFYLFSLGEIVGECINNKKELNEK